MTLDRLESLIAAYGPEPINWPEAERAAGITALVTHREALSGPLSEAAELDAFLSTAQPITTPATLMASLMPAADAPPVSLGSKIWDVLFGTSRGVPAAIACLCLGIAGGYLYSPADLSMTETEALLTIAFENETLFTALESDI